MPRRARLDAPGTLHHVIARGIERRKIFLGQADCEEFVARLEKAITRGKAQLLAWALLPNHFHLLLRSGEPGLSSVMRWLMTGYVVTFNLRYRRHGHLFQNRYKSIVCEEEEYLLELVRYVHLNPLRARVVKSLDELADYPYAGHSALLGRTERPWQATDEVLSRFGRTVQEGRRGYEEFVRAGAAQGRRPELVGGGLRRSLGGWTELPRRGRRGEHEEAAYDDRILGSAQFVKDTLREAERDEREGLRRVAGRIGIEGLGRKLSELSGIAVEELRSGSRGPAAVEARTALSEVAVGVLGFSGSAVARFLGVSPSTVNRRVKLPSGDSLGQRLLEALTSCQKHYARRTCASVHLREEEA